MPCISKLLEKLIFVRLNNFLQKRSIINAAQYGFQKGRSTEHAVLDVITSVYDNINQNNYTGLAFLDFRKAFDTISHSILLQKLNHYGIRDMAGNLISAYLSNRKQSV